MPNADRRRFAKLIADTLEREGGYVNNPADPGGETKYGISKRSYPRINIRNLTLAQAKAIYYRDWWVPLRCSEITADTVAQKLLDTAINMGKERAVELLQQALRALGQQVTVDGLIGSKTIEAVNVVSSEALLSIMRKKQALYYKDLIAQKPSLARYEQEWLVRAYS